MTTKAQRNASKVRTRSARRKSNVLALHNTLDLRRANTLDLRRAERVRTLDALRCAFVVIAYYAAVAFRMTSMCGRLRKIQ